MTDRYCPACDLFFSPEERNTFRHTYQGPRCQLARKGIPPRPYSEDEQTIHNIVDDLVSRLTGVVLYEEVDGKMTRK
jgi:hypothetical protein